MKKRKTSAPPYNLKNAALYPKDHAPLEKEMDTILSDPRRRENIRKVKKYLKKYTGKHSGKRKKTKRPPD